MSFALNLPDDYTAQAMIAKEAIPKHLCTADGRSLKMSDVFSQGVCQDVNAYAITTRIMPTSTITKCLASNDLSPAFQNIGHLEKVQIVSPYTTGFAAEASFVSGSAHEAVSIIKRVWGIMADTSNVNYSGAHWEAMKPDGIPFAYDTSLAHGWSTWPTFLLPKYFRGLMPLEAGWKKWSVKPVLAGLSAIDVSLKTVAGMVKVSLRVREVEGGGKMTVMIPRRTTCEISAPKG
jgi:alpha-L-rhamnosidase